jgi:hypothetical protein
VKRFIGQKRYYYNLQQTADEFQIDLNEGSWYDMWHNHIDWPGHSNIGKSHRRKHIELLFKMVTNVLSQVSDYLKPYQTWVVIQKDGSQDAVYFHTPNPNADNFPMKFENVKWGIEPPVLFHDLLPSGLDLGLTEDESGKYYFVRSIKHGIPL